MISSEGMPNYKIGKSGKNILLSVDNIDRNR